MNSREHLLRHGARTAALSEAAHDDFWSPPPGSISSVPKQSEWRQRAAWIAWIAAFAVALAIAGLIAWGASAASSSDGGFPPDVAKKLCSSAYDQAVKDGAKTIDKDKWIANCLDSFAAQPDDQGDDDATFTPDSRL